MNIPLPNNKIVALTIAGGLLTALVAAGLSVPKWFWNSEKSNVSPTAQQVKTFKSNSPRSRTSTKSKQPQTARTDSPRPRKNFQPAVKTRRLSGEEHEEYEENEEREEEGYEEEKREYDDEREHEEEEYEGGEHEE